MKAKDAMIQVLVIGFMFGCTPSAQAGYVREGLKKTELGVEKAWRVTSDGVKKGAAKTSIEVKKGWGATKRFLDKVF